MSISFPEEALETQAVAARTFSLEEVTLQPEYVVERRGHEMVFRNDKGEPYLVTIRRGCRTGRARRRRRA